MHVKKTRYKQQRTVGGTDSYLLSSSLFAAMQDCGPSVVRYSFPKEAEDWGLLSIHSSLSQIQLLDESKPPRALIPGVISICQGWKEWIPTVAKHTKFSRQAGDLEFYVKALYFLSIINRFKCFKNTMPDSQNMVFAKSGSLTTVSE